MKSEMSGVLVIILSAVFGVLGMAPLVTVSASLCTLYSALTTFYGRSNYRSKSRVEHDNRSWERDRWWADDGWMVDGRWTDDGWMDGGRMVDRHRNSRSSTTR